MMRALERVVFLTCVLYIAINYWVPKRTLVEVVSGPPLSLPPGRRRTCVAERTHVVEMEYQPNSYLISLHAPELDQVVSKGIMQGLFSPKNTYPTVDMLRNLCSLHPGMACQPGRVFVDVGSAVGMVGLYAASLGMVVYAIDPLRPNIDRLLESVCLNAERATGEHFWDDFRAIHAFVGSSAHGTREVQSDAGSLASTMRGGGGGTRHSAVPVVTIDSTVTHLDIEILWLTCQGFEYEALVGASVFFSTRRVHHVVWRRHSLVLPENDVTAGRIVEFLETKGFKFYNVAPPVPMLPRESILASRTDGMHYNVLASLVH